MPLVSILVPAFKSAFLEKALLSATDQTFEDVEILVGDDSPDGGMRSIVEAVGDPRIRYFHHGFQNGIRNTEALWDKASGQYVKWLFDDDLLMPDSVGALVQALQAHPDAAMAFHQRVVIDAQGQIIFKPEPLVPMGETALIDRRLLVQHMLPHIHNFVGEPSNIMLNRRHVPAQGIRKYGDYQTAFLTDVAMYLNHAARAPLVAVGGYLSAFRQHEAQASSTSSPIRSAGLFEWEILVRGEAAAGNLGADEVRQAQNRLRQLYANEAPALPELEPFLQTLEELSSLPLSQLYQSPRFWANVSQAHEAIATRRANRARPPAPAAPAPQIPVWARSLSREQAQALRPAGGRVHLSVCIGVGADDAAPTHAACAKQYRAPDAVLDLQQDAQALTALRAEPEGWTLLLAPGDTLQPDALTLIERALLASPAEARVVYGDHAERVATGDPAGFNLSPQFKPAFNHELLLSLPYVGRAIAVRNDWAVSWLEQSDGRNDLACAYRLALAAVREQGAQALVHVPALLAHLTPSEPAMYCSTSEGWQALAQVLADHLQQSDPGAQLLEGPGPGTFHVIHPLPRTPKVSVVIPTRDQLPFLSRCVETLLGQTDYPDFEVLVVDNDSQTDEAQAFLSGLESLDPERLRVLRMPGAFNFSRMNNAAVAQARGEFILLLNNDTAVLHADWLSHMMRHALRDDVGIVGARLLYPDGTVQHAGVIMGLRGPAEHPGLGLKADEPGYMFRAQVAQDFSAVTAACLLVSRAVYEEVGGLDESVFAVSYNDVDFCLRVGRTGRRIVWTPLATLLHEGSASQKAAIESLSGEKKVARFTREQAAMYERWPEVVAQDPAYNPNLSLLERGYEVETNPLLCHDKLRGLTEHRVVAFPADAFGCGHYRILQPMQAMLDAGLCTGGSSPELFGPNLALRSGADTLVFQRPMSDANFALLESLLTLKRVRKIYEVDDDLSRLPVKSAHRAHMPKDVRARMLRNIALCDRLVVSTPTLAEQFRGSNDDIRVVPNRLPPAMWGAAPPVRAPHGRGPARKPVVGWAGGVGHQGDLEMIAQVVRETADHIDWVFFGMCPEPLRPLVKAFHVGVPTLDYPQRLMALTREWDLAIAPLEVNAFNEAKSNLRLLEYGWCGVPVVCSDITPYQGDLPVHRVKNRYKDWKQAVLERVADLDQTQAQGLALQQQVARDWVLTPECATDWLAAWT